MRMVLLNLCVLRVVIKKPPLRPLEEHEETLRWISDFDNNYF